ncbi:MULTISPECIES: TauD/TfdA dioxygenase family protein [Sphingobium]|uniref:TauD/TfdA dioxygenase family protein n=1 Tax=Sphingobium TaxID=165695 RepID=UPI0015EB4550|nr:MULTISPECIES: TauD/TfdA family dioxygenase [Sphingobium]MCW2363142.1 taurine dioxygenase [Sphingobium sp. B10D3B]MCW2400178.1 taurine dioxygenase [Sphingobium sp. B10D7B]MCW2407156.1 taurine dioxygenase [Sphingobium xanthum]
MTVLEKTLIASDTDLFEIKPLQPSLGAQISGIDLSQPLTRPLHAALHAALLRYKVLFFRDQHLTHDQHIALGAAFGDLETHPVFAHPDHPEILPLRSKEFAGKYRSTTDSNWHADTTFRAEPSAASILIQRVSPGLGGDTVFANAVAAYETLDDDTKARIDGLSAIHDTRVFLQFIETPEKRAALQVQYPPVEHPVVRIHPGTGEKVLHVNSVFTREIVGLAQGESEALLARLFDQVKRPEFQVRWSWQPGSIAFWDNRATQHYAVPDYRGNREMERVTIVGERPRGPQSPN